MNDPCPHFYFSAVLVSSLKACLFVAVASTNEVVTVDLQFTVSVTKSDGSHDVVKLRKDVPLAATAFERAKSDQQYHQRTCAELQQAHTPELLSLRTSWSCGICQGARTGFLPRVMGLERVSIETGKVSLSMFLLPVCSKEACRVQCEQLFSSCLNQDARAEGVRAAHPNPRIVQHCGQCSQVEEGRERFQQCARCKVKYYCSRECQVAHWPVNKKGCRPPASNLGLFEFN